MNMQGILKPLLVIGLVIFGVGGLIGIGLVLFGVLNEFVLKIFLSSLAVGYYAVMAACTFGEGRAYTFTGLAGMGTAICGLAIMLPVIWIDEWWRADIPFRAMIATALVSFALAHGTTNYRLSGMSGASISTMVIANFCVTMLTCLFLIMILDTTFRMSEGFLRVLIALCIAVVVLTVMNPFVNKLSKK